jgi:hypothetical protein
VFGVCLLWGAGFGLLEAAYFTRVNDVFPLGTGHLLLAVFLVLEYTVVALAAPVAVWITRRVWGSLTGPLRLWAGPWFLAFILAVSHYRDRMVLHARSREDLIITVVGMLVLAIILLGLGRRARDRSPAGIRRVLVAVGALLTVAGGIGLTTARSRFEIVPTVDAVAAADLDPIPDTGVRVLLVGMDGGEWSVIDPLFEAGGMPVHAALAARGRTAVVKTVEPTFSPIIWTGVATGKSLEKHRIFSHVYTQPPFGLPGIPHDPKRIKHLTKVMKLNVRGGHRLGLLPLGIYASSNLGARQIWDVLGEFGLPTISLEWYVTHPVRPVRGIQISDRFHLLQGREDALSFAVFPDSLVPELAPLITAERDLSRADLMQFLDVDNLDSGRRDELASSFRPWFKTIGGEMSRDLTTCRVVGEVFPRVPDWRLGAVYYRGMDGSHHMTWKWRNLPPEDLDEFPERRFRNAIDAYYRFCDDLLRDTLDQADENTVVIVLSDHGWENQLWGHSRKPDGFCILAGGPIVPSSERGVVSIYDIAPTILALLGVPVPDDMDGEVARDFFDPGFWKEFPIRYVPSYERPDALTVTAADAAGDERILEQLRTLGYIGD